MSDDPELDRLRAEYQAAVDQMMTGRSRLVELADIAEVLPVDEAERNALRDEVLADIREVNVMLLDAGVDPSSLPQVGGGDA
jgi:hypothetical protein